MHIVLRDSSLWNNCKGSPVRQDNTWNKEKVMHWFIITQASFPPWLLCEVKAACMCRAVCNTKCARVQYSVLVSLFIQTKAGSRRRLLIRKVAAAHTINRYRSSPASVIRWCQSPLLLCVCPEAMKTSPPPATHTRKTFSIYFNH